MSEHLLETRGLCKSFGALKATDNVSISLKPGEIHAIIGPNGAGKSTLIAQICGGLAPDAGQILMQGRDVTSLTTQARAQAGLGRTFQVSALAMEDTVLENVCDQQTATLSHGQRRQLEVAVALTLEPSAFVMDEPMAGLGAEGTKKMTEFLDGLRAQAPILLVEHDMDAVFALADRISVLVYGQIIATGSVADIRASATVRDAYLGDPA